MVDQEDDASQPPITETLPIQNWTDELETAPAGGLMALQPGARIGPFEVTGSLGAGGMGEVYRATDSKLGRSVAIKVLPAIVASDPERIARFEREARTLATLNHPNIAHIYGLEESGGLSGLVMELVEGPTLADRIAQGPLPVDEAIPIARQIAEAIEAAHEQGIVHRDLKPANIKVRADGTAKVLDFGLAKAMEPAAAEAPASVTMSPTITSPAMTRAGMILGTAAYMSPEQAKGRPADKRSDIWAFGCVLFEMLAGRRAFDGEDVGETLAAVLKTEPAWDALPGGIPVGLRRLLRRCLEKDPRRRLQHIGDARIEIDDARRDAPAETPPPRTARLLWAAALALAAIATIAMAALLFSQTTAVPDAPEMRVEITTPPTTDPISLELSPDGRQIVFVASNGDTARLWLRELYSTGSQIVSPSYFTSRPLPGTEYASLPFWSPDSRSVGFFADGQLKKIDVDTGVVQSLARAPVPAGGTWSRDGLILYPQTPTFAMLVVPQNGGTTRLVSTFDIKNSAGHSGPQFLPDGQRFLYFVAGAPQVRGTYVRSLDGTLSPRRLRETDGPAVYAAGRLWYLRQNRLLSVPFDPVSLATAGDAETVAEQVATGALDAAAFSVAEDGTVAYRTGTGWKRQLVWVDRSGREIERIGEPDTRNASYVSISPDRRRLAAQRPTSGEATGIWLLDLSLPRWRPVTDDTQTNIAPIWSPKGDRLVYSALRDGVFDLYVRPLEGSGAGELLLKTGQSKQAMDWSRDGRHILFRSAASEANQDGFRDIWALPLEGGGKEFPVVRTRFDERHAQFSPDARWVAYQSDASGRFEIYVQRFPTPGEARLISKGGGAQVRWDGRGLYYIRLDGQLVAVPVTFPSDGTIAPGKEEELFAAKVGGVQDLALPSYIVSDDGQRFLMDRVVEEAAQPITLILNRKHAQP